ncbi:hypothetical protein R1sor_025707 [Riccia sorocarpa]|uniref:Uncharacterized protein n=1 Tax=Riccia sorocarpa TaxID=122646 RepID=A0ABD3GDA6_9MARC
MISICAIDHLVYLAVPGFSNIRLADSHPLIQDHLWGTEWHFQVLWPGIAGELAERSCTCEEGRSVPNPGVSSSSAGGIRLHDNTTFESSPASSRGQTPPPVHARRTFQAKIFQNAAREESRSAVAVDPDLHIGERGENPNMVFSPRHRIDDSQIPTRSQAPPRSDSRSLAHSDPEGGSHTADQHHDN